MNPLNLVTRPIKNLTEAAVAPFRALFVIGICFAINWMTSPGTWWVQWVALGMGISVAVAWARASKTLLLLGLIAFVGWKVYQRHGEAARAQFDEWVGKTQPQAAQVVEVLRTPFKRA